MANEFVIKKGFHSKADSQVTGALDVSGVLTAGGSVVGAAFPFEGDAQITGSLVISGSGISSPYYPAALKVDGGVYIVSGSNSGIVGLTIENTTAPASAEAAGGAGIQMIGATAESSPGVTGSIYVKDHTGGTNPYHPAMVLEAKDGGMYFTVDADTQIGSAFYFDKSYMNLRLDLISTSVSEMYFGNSNGGGSLARFVVGQQGSGWYFENSSAASDLKIGTTTAIGGVGSYTDWILIYSGSAAGEHRIQIGDSLDMNLSVSGSITTNNTASAAYFSGDGSQLTNLPASDPFPYSGSAIISSSYTAGDTNSNVLKLIGSGSVSGSSLFEVQGAAGTLFAVNDGLDGELFAANNISGLPVISANADNSVRLGKYQGFGIFISGSTPGPTNEAAKIFITGSIYNTGSVLGIHRPVATHTANFTSSIGYLGNYNIVGGNLTCSIQTSSLMPGAEFEFFQTSSTGNFLFESASNVSLIVKNDNMNLAGQGSGATLKYISGDTFHMVGDLT